MSARRDGSGGGGGGGGLPWFRFYGAEVLGDPKLAMLTDGQFRVWVNLLCLASTQDERGAIVGHSDKLLAALVARGDQQLVRETLRELEDLRIVAVQGEADAREIVFINFGSRQYDKPSDRPERVAARVAAFRARRAALRNAPVTPCNAPEEETDSETDLPPGDPLRDLTPPAEPAAAPLPPSAPVVAAAGDPDDSPADGSAQVASHTAAATAPEPSPKPPKLKPIYGDDSVPMQLARTLAAGIHCNKPDAKLPRDGFQGWAREFDLMLRVDHRPREKIEAVIAYAMASSFWRSVMFSAGKLREKFDILDAQRQEDANGTRRQASGNGTSRRPNRGAKSGGYGASAGRPAIASRAYYEAAARRLGQGGVREEGGEEDRDGDGGSPQTAAVRVAGG